MAQATSGEHAITGRWAGRLTSRPLPDHDPSLELLNPAERAEIAEHWLSRAAFERRVSDAFVVISEALEALSADSALLELARRSIDDELRHAELSRMVASRFAGHELAAPARLELIVPAHAQAAPMLRHSLHVIGQCVLNETFASAVLEASLELATGALAKAALRELLSDEVDHARLGWGYLATLDAETRAAVAPWLPGLLRANLQMWRQAPRDYSDEPRILGHGAISRALLERALSSALHTLILPGLAQLGFATDALALEL